MGMEILKWAWRYSVLQVEEFDQLHEAASAAFAASDYGTEAFECIEIIEKDGSSRRLGWDDIEQFRPQEIAEPEWRPTHGLQIRFDKHWAVWGSYESEVDARFTYDLLMQKGVVEDRLKIQRLVR